MPNMGASSGTRSVSDTEFSQSLDYLQLQNEISWGWNPSPNTKSIYVSYIPYTHSLKVTYTIFFDNFVHETKFV